MKKIIFVLIISSFLQSGCAPFFRAINYSPSSKLKKISFSEKQANSDYQFYYTDTLNHNYLRKLRHDYGLDKLTSMKMNRIDRAQPNVQVKMLASAN